MPEMFGIDCTKVLKMSMCPIVGLMVLEVIWNASESVIYGPGVSGFFWVVKLGILGYAGYIWVNGDPIRHRLLGGD